MNPCNSFVYLSQHKNKEMGLFDRFSRNKKNDVPWEAAKSAGEVYPENSISIVMLSTDSGKPATGWVDKAYEEYPYKKSCPYNLLIMAELNDSFARKKPDLDMGTIEDYFLRELRKVCIAHIVARIVTDAGLNIEMYIDQPEPAVQHLQTLFDNPERVVSFDYEVNEDPEWLAVSELMKI